MEEAGEHPRGRVSAASHHSGLPWAEADLCFSRSKTLHMGSLWSLGGSAGAMLQRPELGDTPLVLSAYLSGSCFRDERKGGLLPFGGSEGLEQVGRTPTRPGHQSPAPEGDVDPPT